MLCKRFLFFFFTNKSLWPKRKRGKTFSLHMAVVAKIQVQIPWYCPEQIITPNNGRCTPSPQKFRAKEIAQKMHVLQCIFYCFTAVPCLIFNNEQQSSKHHWEQTLSTEWGKGIRIISSYI